MLQMNHTYFLDMLDRHGYPTQSIQLDEDAFMPCYEDALFTAICAGQVPNSDYFPIARVEPFGVVDDSPAISGVTIQLPGVIRHYSIHVFADHAQGLQWTTSELSEESSEAVELQLAATALWRIRAEISCLSSGPRRQVTIRRRPYPLHPEPLDGWGISSGTATTDPFVLCVSQSVLDELRRDTVESLHTERADVLSGRLIQDPGGTVAVVVTGRTPATVEVERTAASFRFSPLTFAAARAEIVGRDPDGTIVGWAHNHPACQDCATRQPFCQTDTVFFSLADRRVHRTSFAAPYEIGLVLGKGRAQSPTDPIVRAYAWHRGMIREHPIQVF